MSKSRAAFEPWQPGLWRFRFPDAGEHLLAGTGERSCDVDGLRQALAPKGGLALAGQTHGASVSAVGVLAAPADVLVAGCDGLATRAEQVGLVIRTADCLPIVLWDPVKRAAGVVHAGWRGLLKQLPVRMISFLHQLYQSRAEDLWVGIGPSIRPCCYEVGREFKERFGRFVKVQRGRLVCDLIGAAKAQLRAGGVRHARILDAGQCTSCQPARWYSVRQDAASDGRLLSFVMLS